MGRLLFRRQTGGFQGTGDKAHFRPAARAGETERRVEACQQQRPENGALRQILRCRADLCFQARISRIDRGPRGYRARAREQPVRLLRDGSHLGMRMFSGSRTAGGRASLPASGSKVQLGGGSCMPPRPAIGGARPWGGRRAYLAKLPSPVVRTTRNQALPRIVRSCAALTCSSESSLVASFPPPQHVHPYAGKALGHEAELARRPERQIDDHAPATRSARRPPVDDANGD